MSRIVSRGAVGLVTCICICWAVTVAVGDASAPLSPTPPKDSPPVSNASIEAGPVSAHSFQSNALQAAPTADAQQVTAGGPSPHGGVCAGTEVSEMTNTNTVTPGISLACADPGPPQRTTENNYARCFEPADFNNLGFRIDCVRFGVEACNSEDLSAYTMTVEVSIAPNVILNPACPVALGQDPNA